MLSSMKITYAGADNSIAEFGRGAWLESQDRAELMPRVPGQGPILPISTRYGASADPTRRFRLDPTIWSSYFFSRGEAYSLLHKKDLRRPRNRRLQQRSV